MKLSGQRIYITPKDIDEGERADSTCCPIGRAVNRALLKDKNYRGCAAKVTRFAVRIMANDEKKVIKEFFLPTKVRRFIENFDNEPAFQTTEARRFNFRLA